MEFEIALTFTVLIFAFLALSFDVWSADAILLTAVSVLIVGGVLSIDQAVQQFGNTTIVAIGSLYVIALALRKSGALDKVSKYLLGDGSQNIKMLLARMTIPVTVYSGFLNNTPVVAMGIPTIRRWCRKNGILSSKLLIPLSFAAILGGICTLIGTSTNLISHGLLESNGMPGFSFFELAWVGLPCAIVGLIYIIFISPKLTPERTDIREEEETHRKAMLEIELTEDSKEVGKKVSESGFREFPGFRLFCIKRGDSEIVPVPEDEVLQANDLLLYSVKEDEAEIKPNLTEYPGLRLEVKPSRRIEGEEEKERELHHVVVKEGSRLVGATVEEANLLDQFGANVTGVRRGGKRIEKPLGNFILHPGDVLLMDTRKGFQETHQNSPDFYLTSAPGGEETPLNEDEEGQQLGKDFYISVAVLLAVITIVSAGFFHIALAGMLGVACLVALKVVGPGEAREAIDWNVLIVIGAALALGKAVEVSGAANMLAGGLIELTGSYGPRALLAGIIIVTAILTEIITNNGAIAIMFPIALSMAQSQGLEPRSFIVGITLAASMSLLTPIGYQTNLMVYGPGNYKFSDFFKVGALLQIILWAVVVILAPIIWPV